LIFEGIYSLGIEPIGRRLDSFQIAGLHGRTCAYQEVLAGHSLVGIPSLGHFDAGSNWTLAQSSQAPSAFAILNLPLRFCLESRVASLHPAVRKW